MYLFRAKHIDIKWYDACFYINLFGGYDTVRKHVMFMNLALNSYARIV